MLKDRYSTPKSFTLYNMGIYLASITNEVNAIYILLLVLNLHSPIPDAHFVYLLNLNCSKIHFPLTKNDLPLQLNAISKCPSVSRFRRKEKT